MYHTFSTMIFHKILKNMCTALDELPNEDRISGVAPTIPRLKIFNKLALLLEEAKADLESLTGDQARIQRLQKRFAEEEEAKRAGRRQAQAQRLEREEDAAAMARKEAKSDAR